MLRTTSDQITIQGTFELDSTSVTVTRSDGTTQTFPHSEIDYVISIFRDEHDDYDLSTGYLNTPTYVVSSYDYEKIVLNVFDEDGNKIHSEDLNFYDLDANTRQHIQLYLESYAP